MKMILSAILATVIIGAASAAPPTHFVKDVRFNEDGAGADTVMAEADAIKINSITAFIETLLDDANAAAARGTLELASTSTDNALVRFNGTTGGTQNGLTVEDDSGNVTTAGNLKVGTGASAGTITIEGGTSVPDVTITAESTGGSAKTFRVPLDATVNTDPNYAVWSKYRWNGSTSQPNWWMGDAGNSTLTGVGNYGFGKRSLNALTTGYLNVAVGEDNLKNVTTGIANVGIGESNGMWITTGIDNVAIGSDALGGDEAAAGLNEGNNNIGIGNNAGIVYDGATEVNWSGPHNIAIGLRASFGDISTMPDVGGDGGGNPYQRVVIAPIDGKADANNQIMLGRLDGSDTVVAPGILESRLRVRVDDGSSHSSNVGALNIYKGAGGSANGLWVESTAGAGVVVYQEDGTANSASIIETFSSEPLKLNPGAGASYVSAPDLRVDNLKADGNTISSTDTNGNINLTPNGTGDVVLAKATVTNDLTVSGNDIVLDTGSFNATINGGTQTDNTTFSLPDGAGTARTIAVTTDITGGTLAGSFTTISASAQPGAVAYHNTTQSISDSTFTAVAFNTEIADTGACHDTSSNTSRFVAPSAGTYLITGTITFAGNATGERLVFTGKNLAATSDGTGDVRGTSTQSITGTGTARLNFSALWTLAANDYVEVFARQNSTGALNSGNATHGVSSNKVAFTKLF